MDDATPNGYRMTARQRAAYEDFVETSRAFDWDLRYAVSTGRVIPEAWRTAFGAKVVKKEQVTIRLDADAVKYFRSFGRGWQASLNLVVRAYVKARLAGILKSPDLSHPTTPPPPRPGKLKTPETVEEIDDGIAALRREMGLD